MRIERIIPLLNQSFVERNSILYCDQPPSDVIPSKNECATDRSKWSSWRKANFDFFCKHGARSSGICVADVGIGMGHFKDAFIDQDVFGIDFYPYPDVQVVADFNKGIPLIDSAVDRVVASNVLEHMSEPKVFIRECRRVIKKEGELLLTVPFLINVHQRPYDFYRYTDIALHKLLKDAGFTHIKIEAVVDLPSLSFNALSQLFIAIAKDPEKSMRTKLFFRIYWFFIRRSLFGPLSRSTKKVKGSKDYPLGYHVWAR